jgi:hypothetical protein
MKLNVSSFNIYANEKFVFGAVGSCLFWVGFTITGLHEIGSIKNE